MTNLMLMAPMEIVQTVIVSAALYVACDTIYKRTKKATRKSGPQTEV